MLRWLDPFQERMMNKILRAATFTLVGTALLFLGGCDRKPAADQPRIDIVYTSPHPVINEIIAGFKATVQKAYPKAEFIERHANGRPEEYSTTVLAAINDRPTLLAPITTPITALAVEQARGSVPIVFMGVTDPVGAHVANSIDKPGIATGSSDLCPFSALLDVVHEVLPNAHRLGLPYNPTDEPAVFGRGQLRTIASRRGFTIEDRQVTEATDLSPAVRGLAERTDAIIIAADNLMMENPALISSSADDGGKPTFACDTTSVKAGAVAGVSVNYRDIGVLAGERAVEVLRGKVAGTLPVAVLNSGGVAINRRAACTAHIKIPDAVAARAADVFDRDYVCPSR
jgi:putative ABC transport system substrate-binding protein